MTISTEVKTGSDQQLPDKDVAASFYARYEPKQILGTGASSTVRLCVDRHLQEEYAVKIIDVNSGVDYPDVIRRECEAEVEIHRKVNDHPNIIKLMEVFQSDAYIFLVLEKCQNGELFDLLNTSQSFSEKKTRNFMRQVFGALLHIHSKGIVHRDMKPENILLDAEMNAKISDFGLACLVTDREELSQTKGTPIYLAPEVLRVGYYDNEPPYGMPVDLWACGVIMYTCLVGRPPFWHRKEHLMLRSIMEAKYPTDLPEWQDMNDQPKDLICKLLVVNPSERLTAMEVLQHPFFSQGIQSDIASAAVDPKRKFRSAFRACEFIIRLQHLKNRVPAISRADLLTDPYSNKRIRKLIDIIAFNVYSHWVKKGDDQNRAALFEISPKRDNSAS